MESHLNRTSRLQTNVLNAITGIYSMMKIATIGLSVNCSTVLFSQVESRKIAR